MCEPSNVATLCAVWHLPGRELAGLWWLPRERAATPWYTERIPAAHWFFDLLTFFSCFYPLPCLSSSVTKDRNVWTVEAERSISCHDKVFPALTKRIPQRMPRTGKMKNYIIFSWNRDNNILIPLSSLNWPKHIKRERGKYIVSISIICYTSCICWEEKEGGKKGRGRRQTPSRMYSCILGCSIWRNYILLMTCSPQNRHSARTELIK